MPFVCVIGIHWLSFVLCLSITISITYHNQWLEIQPTTFWRCPALAKLRCIAWKIRHGKLTCTRNVKITMERYVKTTMVKHPPFCVMGIVSLFLWVFSIVVFNYQTVCKLMLSPRCRNDQVAMNIFKGIPPEATPKNMKIIERPISERKSW